MALPTTPGIYCIRNLVNGKRYIGYAKSIQYRWHSHIRTLRNGSHKNSHLSAAFRKYGEESFVMEVLEDCPVERLYEREHYWATQLKTHDEEFGYNIRPTHPAGHVTHDEATCKRIGDKNRGRKRTEETCNRIRYGLLGKRLSLEHIIKSITTRMGRPLSEEHRDRVRKDYEGRIANNSPIPSRTPISKDGLFAILQSYPKPTFVVKVPVLKDRYSLTPEIEERIASQNIAPFDSTVKMNSGYVSAFRSFNLQGDLVEHLGTLREASKKLGIPRTTLQRKIKSNILVKGLILRHVIYK